MNKNLRRKTFFSLGSELDKELGNWLGAADLSFGPARAIIAPHAGYSYCGACGGWAYRQISPSVVKRIFVLGPSHHVRLSGCALTSMQHYETPLYDLNIDTAVIDQLNATGKFEFMNRQTDEDEHSIEMHLPYIAKVMEDYRDRFTVVPVMVGSLSASSEVMYGEIFADYLADPENLFVISSDFCHWGQRFRYTYYDKKAGPIHKSIEQLDKQGMDLIETLDPGAFSEYLKKYQNTICGRFPISVMLQVSFKF